MAEQHMTTEQYTAAIEKARALFEDLSYSYAREWKEQDPSRRVIGYLPIYIPREIIHAMGMLPVGIFGAGDRMSIVKGDAFFQSYICHIPRTVIEMALNGNMDHFDGFLFPSICDVIRNLSGIFRLKFEDKFIQYFDLPQNFDRKVGGTFYRREMERLIEGLKALNGHELTTEELNASIEIYNYNRKLVNELADLRSDFPHKISAVDFYLVLRAGGTMTVEEHNEYLEEILRLAREVDAEPEDKIRVVISGAFCEQPPLGLIKTIENAGCYVVEDDMQLGMKWIKTDIPSDTDDPISALIEAYLDHSEFSSAVYEADNPKGEQLKQQVIDRRADGVLFCAPSFCDPALLDRPLLEQAMDANHIRHFGFQYHENLGQFHVIKEQAGTFADMIKLWE